MDIGYMDLKLFSHILLQYDGDIVQFNKDGEPLMYPLLYDIGRLCGRRVTNIVTNGKLLWEKRAELLYFTTITVSVIEDDPEQFEIVKKFSEAGNVPILIKFLGNYDNLEYAKLGLRTTRRSIHNPQGDTGYKQVCPVIPEAYVCIDFLTKPSINWKGEMFICNRYDPEKKGMIGDATKETLQGIWNSPKRQEWLQLHKQCLRDEIPLCKTCEYWGYPAS
jgi:hypothetical protein